MALNNRRKLISAGLVIICALIVMWGRNFIFEKIPDLDTFKGGLLGVLDLSKEGTQIPGPEVPPQEETIPAKVTKVARTEYLESIASFGTIKGFEEITIKFEESGVISQFYFKEGDEILQYNLVVSQDQQQEVLKLEYAQIEYEKNKTLYDLGAIVADKLRQAELEVGSAELDLKKKNFYAPSDGMMGTRNVNEGELVEPTDIVATFLDINNVFCEIGIIEKDMGKVKVGQDVNVVIDAFTDKAFKGTVDSVSPMIEGRSRTQTVRILVPNEERIIKPGMFAKAQITTFKKSGALVIPRKAIKKTEEGYVALGLERDQSGNKSAAGFELAKASYYPVRVERSTESVVLISAGLIEGQEIILESPQAKEAIEDGSTIEIIGEE